MLDLYDTLGVDKEATAKDIKSAYRKRARECHPDLGGSNGAFSKVNLAYEVLSDEVTRNKYDRTGIVNEVLDEIDQRGVTLLIEEFDNVFINQALDGSNITLQRVRMGIQLRVEGIKSAIINKKSVLLRLDKLLYTLKCSSDSDYIRNHLVDCNKKVNADIESLEMLVKVHLRAIELLDNYSFVDSNAWKIVN